MQVVALPDRTPTEKRVMIRLTVEADCVTLLRRAVVATCGESVELLRTQAVPHSSEVRVWLVLAKSAATGAMDLILKTAPYGEIGSVTAI
jgi:PTS system nitrogen regulatory IIA component